MTKKLRKLWAKYGEAKGELDGAWSEWAAEKEEMLDSVRMLQQQLTLKDLVIQAFVPPEDVQKVVSATACTTRWLWVCILAASRNAEPWAHASII